MSDDILGTSHGQQPRREACILTFFFHAHFPTAPQATGLTFSPHPHVHLALAHILARVLGVLGDAASEETCETKAKQHVLPQHFIHRHRHNTTIMLQHPCPN